MLHPKSLLVAASHGAATVWRASQYGLRVQNVYRDFFGERASSSRSLAPRPEADKQRDAIASQKPPLGRAVATAVDGRSLAARLASQAKGVERAVKTLEDGGREGVLCPVVASGEVQGLAQPLSKVVEAIGAMQDMRRHNVEVTAKEAKASAAPTSEKVNFVMRPLDGPIVTVKAKKDCLAPHLSQDTPPGKPCYPARLAPTRSH